MTIYVASSVLYRVWHGNYTAYSDMSGSGHGKMENIVIYVRN